MREGPQMDLLGQEDVARSGLSLCTTPVRHILLSQVHAAGGQVPSPVPIPWLAFWAIFAHSNQSCKE